MIQFQLDPAQLEEMVISATEKVLAKQQQDPLNHLPIALSKERLCEELDISASTAVTLFRREGFPVVRNLGGPKVPTHLLLKWLEKEANWVQQHAGPNRRLG